MYPSAFISPPVPSAKKHLRDTVLPKVRLNKRYFIYSIYQICSLCCFQYLPLKPLGPACPSVLPQASQYSLSYQNEEQMAMTQFLWAPGHHKGLADVSQVGEAPSVSHHATSLSPQLKSCCTQFPFLFAPGTILIVFHLDIISCLANVDFILTFTRGCVYFGQPDLSAADSLMLL